MLFDFFHFISRRQLLCRIQSPMRFSLVVLSDHSVENKVAFQREQQSLIPTYTHPAYVCITGGAAVSLGAAFESRVRRAPAALPVEPGAGQHSHVGHIRTTSQQVIYIQLRRRAETENEYHNICFPEPSVPLKILQHSG